MEDDIQVARLTASCEDLQSPIDSLCAQRIFPVPLGGNHACQQTWELWGSQILTSMIEQDHAIRPMLGSQNAKNSGRWKWPRTGTNQPIILVKTCKNKIEYMNISWHDPHGPKLHDLHVNWFCRQLLKGQNGNIHRGLGPASSLKIGTQKGNDS